MVTVPLIYSVAPLVTLIALCPVPPLKVAPFRRTAPEIFCVLVYVPLYSVLQGLPEARTAFPLWLPWSVMTWGRSFEAGSSAAWSSGAIASSASPVSSASIPAVSCGFSSLFSTDSSGISGCAWDSLSDGLTGYSSPCFSASLEAIPVNTPPPTSSSRACFSSSSAANQPPIKAVAAWTNFSHAFTKLTCVFPREVLSSDTWTYSGFSWLLMVNNWGYVSPVTYHAPDRFTVSISVSSLVAAPYANASSHPLISLSYTQSLILRFAAIQERSAPSDWFSNASDGVAADGMASDGVATGGATVVSPPGISGVDGSDGASLPVDSWLGTVSGSVS